MRLYDLQGTSRHKISIEQFFQKYLCFDTLGGGGGLKFWGSA